MRETIEPALTPEEWEHLLHGVDGRGLGTIAGAREILVKHAVKANEWRGVAALALYGQPFGFTWRAYDVIREVLEEAVGYHLSKEQKEELEVHAEHAAALLPPRDIE